MDRSEPESGTGAVTRLSTHWTRRQFLAQVSAGAVIAAVPTALRADEGIAGRYASLDSDRYLGMHRTETRIADEIVFTEGPAVDRQGNVYFTNVRVSKILHWNPTAGKLSVFRENSNRANGLLFDPEGNLLTCEGGAGRVTRTDMTSGEITVLVDQYQGEGIGAPNDLALDQKGRIYFTSRFDANAARTRNVDSVYRIDPDGQVTRIIAEPACKKPNGIVTSPDDSVLYLIEAHPNADHPRNIQAFDLDADGNVSNQRTLIDFYPGRSGDGMCIDSQGNLYVAAGLHDRRNTSETLSTRPGIHVISPQGELLAYRETPEDTITNCTFGGEDLRTLYVACGTYLLSIRTEIPGKPAYRPNR